MDLERVYVDFRENAFKFLVAASEASDGDEIVKAMVIDWHLGDGIMTLVCVNSGEASIYLSNGVGKIGNKDEAVKNLSTDLIIKSNNFIEIAERPETTNLPENDQINFFMLSGKNKFLIKENMINIRENNSQVIELFEISNSIISKLMQI